VATEVFVPDYERAKTTFENIVVNAGFEYKPSEVDQPEEDAI
jgi:hypothetical protein